MIVATSHAGARHRRRRPRPGHPDRRPTDRRRVPPASRPHRPAARHQPQRAVPRHQRRCACCEPPRCCSAGARATSNRSCRRRCPLHLVAQQLLALALQERGVGGHTWTAWLGEPFVFGAEAATAPRDHHAPDRRRASSSTTGGMLGIGLEAEATSGAGTSSSCSRSSRRHPVFSVRHGRNEIGLVPDESLLARPPAPRRRCAPCSLLAGRSWPILHVDWPRRVVQVEPTDAPGVARWTGGGQPLGADISPWGAGGACRRRPGRCHRQPPSR